MSLVFDDHDVEFRVDCHEVNEFQELQQRSVAVVVLPRDAREEL